MDLHDIGGFVWAILIVFAVISSIIRSARRSIGSAQTQQPRQQQMQTQQQPVAPSAPVIPSRIVVKRAPTASVVAPPPPRPLIFPTAAKRKQERLFGPGLSVVRGIVALEVLGPPRALREWTPLV
jgi:hypothetical protein